MNNRFVIECINNRTLLWNKAEGWVEGEDFDVFSLDETEKLTLPLAGVWVRLNTFLP